MEDLGLVYSGALVRKVSTLSKNGLASLCTVRFPTAIAPLERGASQVFFCFLGLSAGPCFLVLPLRPAVPVFQEPRSPLRSANDIDVEAHRCYLLLGYVGNEK